MEKYEDLEIEIVEFDEEDVITTSGCATGPVGAIELDPV